MSLTSAGFREAKAILAKAFQELEERMEKGDSLRVRDSCEMGWLSAIATIDSLLISHGYEEAKTHIDRRRKLKELILKIHGAAELGTYDRVEARRSVLHNDGFFNSVPTPDEVKKELRKVERLISDLESLTKIA